MITGLENELFNLVQEALYQIVSNKPLLAVEALGAMKDIMAPTVPFTRETKPYGNIDSEKA